MRLRCKILLCGLFAGVTLLATGCGGLRGSYSVSPLTFFLPGIGKVDTKTSEQRLRSNEEGDKIEMAPSGIMENLEFEKYYDVEAVSTKELAQIESSQIGS